MDCMGAPMDCMELPRLNLTEHGACWKLVVVLLACVGGLLYIFGCMPKCAAQARYISKHAEHIQACPSVLQIHTVHVQVPCSCVACDPFSNSIDSGTVLRHECAH